MPILMKDGKFLILNDNYELDRRQSIRSAIDRILTEYCLKFNFTADNTQDMLEKMTDSVLETIEFYDQEKTNELKLKLNAIKKYHENKKNNE